MGQTVNLLSSDFVCSNHATSTIVFYVSRKCIEVLLVVPVNDQTLECTSIGRESVSKTERYRFESYCFSAVEITTKVHGEWVDILMNSLKAHNGELV